MHVFDSRPDGFAAHYVLDKRIVTVIFLALNLGQRVQKNAMVEAAKRKRKKTGGNAPRLDVRLGTPDDVQSASRAERLEREYDFSGFNRREGMLVDRMVR
jgi:hypothetical protein